MHEDGRQKQKKTRRYNIMPDNTKTIQCQHNTIQDKTKPQQCNTTQHNTVQDKTRQYNTV